MAEALHHMANELDYGYSLGDWRMSHGNLREKFEYAYENELFTDIIFVVGAEHEKFQAHSLILKLQSPMFEKKYGHFNIKEGMRIEMLTFDPKYFRIFLKYLYTEQEHLITNAESAMSILQIAKEFEIRKLVEICSRFFREEINTDFAQVENIKSLKKFLPSTLRIKNQSDEIYGKVLENSVKIYESEMTRMSEIPNFNEMICREAHENCKRKALEEFYSNVDENSPGLEYFELELENGIDKFYKKTLSLVTKLKVDEYKIANFSSSLKSESNKIMIGIHFGAKHIRCSIYQNSKFVQIPDENGKFAIPNFVAFVNNKYIFGGEAKNYSKLVISSPNFFNFNEIQLDKIGPHILNQELKIILGLVLYKIKLMSEKFLKTKVDRCVISVPSSVDFQFRQELMKASQIVGFEKTHILCEAVAAGYLYAFKNREVSKLLVTYFAKNQFDATVLLAGIKGVTVISNSGLHQLETIKRYDSNIIKLLLLQIERTFWDFKSKEGLVVGSAIKDSNFSHFDHGIQLWDGQFSERKYLREVIQNFPVQFTDQVDPTEGVVCGAGLIAYQFASGQLSPSNIIELPPFDYFMSQSNQIPFEDIIEDQKVMMRLMGLHLNEVDSILFKRLQVKIDEIEKILNNQPINGSNIYDVIQKCKNCLRKFDVTLPEIEENLSRLLSSWRDVLLIMK